MVYLTALTLLLVLITDWLLACPKHELPLQSLNLKTPADILVNIVGLIIISTSVG